MASMKNLFLLCSFVVSFCLLPCSSSKAQEATKPRIVAHIAVNPVVNLAQTKAVPVLIQLEALNGAKLPSQVYLAYRVGEWNDTGLSFIPLPLGEGYAQVILNLKSAAGKFRDGEHCGINYVAVYLDEKKDTLLAYTEIDPEPQERIHLLAVEGATKTLMGPHGPFTWIVPTSAKEAVQVVYHIEDQKGHGIVGVPYIVDRVRGTAKDGNPLRYSSGVTDEKGQVIIPVPTDVARSFVYQVLTECLVSDQTAIEIKKYSV